MGRGGNGAQSLPGAELEPDLAAVEENLRRRRWRVMRAALPPGYGEELLPNSVTTPEQFIGWLITRLTPAALDGYFEDLEVIAKQACDLEMLRLARSYRRKA